MNNKDCFERAQRHIPGGVNSPVRAFGAVGGTPLTIAQGIGARIRDVDGQWYTDYVGSWGPLISGHAHPEIIAAVRRAAEQGLSFGAPTSGEIEMAETLCRLLPSMEMVRLVSSGTEATMSAIRLARGATRRDLLIKFEGCYHGHSDSLLIKAGSGALTFGHPSSAGIPDDLAQHTLVLPYNDREALANAFARFKDQIAALIIEPIAGNMNLVVPDLAFLQDCRALTEQYGSVLIFDEVMTGFRVGLGGVQGLYQIKPDLTTLGKIIGGGMPLAAFGGRRDIMAHLAPLGAVYQAGTLSGNPVAVAAGLKQLELLQADGFYQMLDARTELLCAGLNRAAHSQLQGRSNDQNKNQGQGEGHGAVDFCARHVGSMFGIYFAKQPPGSYAEVLNSCNKAQFNHFFHYMLAHGHYFAPSAYEAGFVSMAHGEAEINATVDVAAQYFANLAVS